MSSTNHPKFLLAHVHTGTRLETSATWRGQGDIPESHDGQLLSGQLGSGAHPSTATGRLPNPVLQKDTDVLLGDFLVGLLVTVMQVALLYTAKSSSRPSHLHFQ